MLSCIARYSSEKPVAPPAWTTYSLRQYTDDNAGDQHHQIPGIGRCDRDKFNGSPEGLQKLWGVLAIALSLFYRRFIRILYEHWQLTKGNLLFGITVYRTRKKLRRN
ncbi:MAG: hypothetical protein ABI891_07770 [Acidobacteriota bacterium]